ncbi:MAG: VOC family protein [Lewinellaceae bacterium]|nr:VOC family protein [Saprospiraceae bacterium]MCB9330947.1 VOC family protein [Lewinellaceae bacterium]
MIKYILLALGLWLPLPGTAQTADSLPDPEAFFTAIIVRDIDSSIAWYTENLGFTLIDRAENAAIGFQQANLKRGAVLLELLELQAAIYPEDILAEAPPKTRIAGLFKFGFRMAEFDRWLAFLEQSGVDFLGTVVADPVSGRRMVLIKDPDGNRIQLFEP